jgi:hypothetical protein
MSQPVRTRLAKACQGLQLPTGTVVFEEDDKGDAMYVVVSGSLQVRARPLNPAGPVKPQPDELPLPPAQTGAGAADAATAAAGSIGGAAPGKMRATADAVCAGASSSGGGARSSQIGSSRRTTWEGAAFTAKERTKLDAVRTALEAEKLEVRDNLQVAAAVLAARPSGRLHQHVSFLGWQLSAACWHTPTCLLLGTPTRQVARPSRQPTRHTKHSAQTQQHTCLMCHMHHDDAG